MRLMGRFLARLLIALIVVVLGLSLLIKIRDVYLQHKLTGIWVCTFQSGLQSTWRIERGGRYTGGNFLIQTATFSLL